MKHSQIALAIELRGGDFNTNPLAITGDVSILLPF